MTKVQEEIAITVYGILVTVLASITMPTTASCPMNMYVEGVRPSGVTRCVRPLPDDPNHWPGEPEPEPSRLEDEIPLRIYCTGGTIPIVVNERTVGCQHRH